MNRRLILSISLILMAVVALEAQTITGMIVNGEQQPVDGATVVLQTMDSTYVDVSISGADGIFRLNHQPERYRLIIQHLQYETKQQEGTGSQVGRILLESKEYTLREVVVRAERPFVKVEDGRLEYDLTQLAGDKVVNNAYEALVKLPGVKENKGVLTLAGAGEVTVILNGKPTTMGAAQLETLLKNTPVGRVEKAEVMYSAPPKYHVRGAVINVVLRRSDDYSFQGEVNAEYTNQYFHSGNANGNFRLSTPKMAFDFMYGASDEKIMEYMNVYSKHTLKDQIYEINQNNRISTKYWGHNLRGAFEYNFDPRNNLSLSYTGNFIPRQHNNSLTAGNYQNCQVDKYIDTRMHNLSLQYHSGSGLEIGGDYTRYTSGNEQTLNVGYQNGGQNHFSLSAGQQIDRYSVYADQNHSLTNEWNLGYGVSYKFAKDIEHQTYHEVSGNLQAQDTYSKLNEQTAGFYLSMAKNYETGTSFSVSAAAEYYSIGNYHKWAFYPQVSLTYTKTPRHMFQLSLSTDKTYPGYWDMQSSVSFIDGYTELRGAPGLRPMTTYNLNGNYIWKQKYIFGLFFMHTADYFAQAGYQSTQQLVLIYQKTNWNYMQIWGVNAVLPFKAGDWLNSSLTLSGMQTHQRCDDFFDIPFNRKKWFFSGSLDNTFKVSKNLAFELNANLQTPAIQGTFDIKSIFDLTAGLKWSFANEKATLSLRCSDLFETGKPDLKIRFKGQHLDMDNGYYSRAFIVHFSYRFGGYTKKDRKPVDTSRFGM